MHSLAVLLSIGVGLSMPPSAGHGTKITTVGDWAIYRTTDSMTDERSCVADYNDDASVELFSDSIGFKLANEAGIQNYRVRWDEGAPSGLFQPSRLEQTMSLLLLDGDKFAPLSGAKRLRVQIHTLHLQVVDFDVDVSGAADVIAVLTGPECKKK